MERITFEMYGQEVGYEHPVHKPEAIIGGTEAPEGVDLSYFVQFVNNYSQPTDSYHCGGSAIGANIIVSAEHCFEQNDNIPNIWARIRGRDLHDEAAVNSQIEKVVVPANPSGDRDIALVFLRYKGVDTIPVIDPTDTTFRENIYVYGNGDTDYEAQGSQISRYPKYADLYEQPSSACGGYVGIGETCLTDEASNVNNAGHGDSGGPAVQIVKNSEGVIYKALRGVIIEADPEGTPDYTIITDLRLSINQEFIQECSDQPEAKPDICEIRYDRSQRTLIPTPTPSAHSGQASLVEAIPSEFYVESLESITAGLLGMALIGNYLYLRLKK